MRIPSMCSSRANLLRNCLVVWILFTTIPTGNCDDATSTKQNVLLIAIDDLRPELGCYGAGHVHTPNIDRFAENSLRFDHAYCQQAVCNASRTSLMTGLRPDTTGVTGNHIHFRSNLPDVVTLPQHFKNSGYHAAAIGKLYHGVFPDGASKTVWDTMGDPQSWSVPAVRFGPRYYYTEAGIAAAKQTYRRVYDPKNAAPDAWTEKLVFGPATESPEVVDDVLYDGQVALAAIQKLKELKSTGTPFFLGVGFIKPHSPYVAPRKYFDLYQDVRLPGYPGFPLGAPELAGHNSGEIRRYTDQPNSGPFNSNQQLQIRRAYYACISFIDAQVGRVLDELARLGLAENTIVCLYGDHGYHLGEQGLWGKTTNFELDTRVPLLISAPGSSFKGGETKALVELVDMYPTLCELANLPVSEQLEGDSLVPLFKDPSFRIKNAAISQHPRGKLMGYSMRTAHQRLTLWLDRSTGSVQETELYQYDSGGLIETENIASKSPHLLQSMLQQFRSVPSLGRLIEGTTAEGLSDETTQEGAEEEAPPRDLRDENRPNILLIISEDNGPELGCYGDEFAKTPNLDQLAVQGMRFETAYVTQAVCSSSRSSIFTGLYPHQNGQLGLATHQFAMFQSWPTSYSVLKQAGYRTGLIGKTHVNPESVVEDFVDYRAIRSSNFAKKNLSDYAAKASEFMSSSDRPFFLTVNLPDAHWPLQNQIGNRPAKILGAEDVGPLPYIGFDNKRLRGHLAGFYNCMSRLDECVGEILHGLEAARKSANTLVIYLGDHGAQFARGKVFVTEGGLRVPLIVRWPNHVRAGAVSNQLVSTIDLLPTLAGVACADVPPGLPGKNLIDVLVGEETSLREYLYGERNSDSADLHFPQRAVRDSRYKVIETLLPDRRDPGAHKCLINGASNFRGSPTYEELRNAPPSTRTAYDTWLEPPQFQLYDLRSDPHEFVNLADVPEMKPVLDRLVRQLRKWQLETLDPLRNPGNLKRLTQEVEECLKLGTRSPRGGWEYLHYLAPPTVAENEPLSEGIR